MTKTEIKRRTWSVAVAVKLWVAPKSSELAVSKAGQKNLSSV